MLSKQRLENLPSSLQVKKWTNEFTKIVLQFNTLMQDSSLHQFLGQRSDCHKPNPTPVMNRYVLPFLKKSFYTLTSRNRSLKTNLSRASKNESILLLQHVFQIAVSLKNLKFVCKVVLLSHLNPKFSNSFCIYFFSLPGHSLFFDTKTVISFYKGKSAYIYNISVT